MASQGKDSSVVKNQPPNTGNTSNVGSVPGSGRSSAGANGNPLQYSCLENSMDRGGWQTTAHGISKSQAWLRDQHFYYFLYKWESKYLAHNIIVYDVYIQTHIAGKME